MFYRNDLDYLDVQSDRYPEEFVVVLELDTDAPKHVGTAGNTGKKPWDNLAQIKSSLDPRILFNSPEELEMVAKSYGIKWFPFFIR